MFHGLKVGLTDWLLVLAALLMLATPGASQAHSSGNSYLDVEMRPEGVWLRTDVSMRDLDVVFDLDADRNGEVVWSEVLARRADVTAWLREGVRITTVDDASCSLDNLDFLASERGDGLYLSTAWAVRCPSGGTGASPSAVPMQLTYGLMFDQDNLHRGLLKVQWPDGPFSAILSPDQRSVSLTPASVGGLDEFLRYLLDGVWHIWIGFDHILFLLSLLVLAPLRRSQTSVLGWQPVASWREAFADVVGVVTAFTVAHSITLGLSVLKWVEPPALVVETVIAISVVLAALNNLLGWLSVRRWRLAFVFGLIHGFGFANVLLDLGLPGQALALALGGFNLGVELGQLAIVVVFLSVAWQLRHTAFYRWGVVVAGSLGIGATGAYWTVSRLMG